VTPELVPSLRLLVEQQPPWTIVRVSGELGWESHTEFGDCLSAVAGQPCICLDLSGLDFCDSSGIARMARAWRDARQRGGQMVLRAPRQNVARMLAWMGLAELLPIVDELPVNPLTQ
jgi:anti-sigma B factor antagonist